MPTVRDRIAILEDDPRRVEEMRACLSRISPGAQQVFFENAADMIRWLRENLGDVLLISLDHDLPLRRVDGELIDFGTGRQVVDFLTTNPPCCPVIVHSSNVAAAHRMCFALRDAGWSVGQVPPCDDLAWIAASWAPQVNRYLQP